MHKYILHIIIMSALLFHLACDGDDNPSDPDSETYSEGDTISSEHQEMEFGYCYPTCPSNPDNCDDLTTDATFSLLQHSGKVFMIEMSAAWWTPCFSHISVGDAVYKNWENDDRVEIVHFLDDIGTPYYSCLQWGYAGEKFIPPIVDDGALYPFRDLFPMDDVKYPLTIFINDEMEIVGIYSVLLGIDDVNAIIQNMLDNI